MSMDELPDALNLAETVFMAYVAPEYSQEGVKTFLEYIQYDAIKKLIDENILRFWVCMDGRTVVGMIAMRQKAHISLMFVDSRCHRRGIARRLFQAAMDAAQNIKETTVHSSLYAVPFYQSLGYRATGPEQTVNGIRFVPMAMPIGAG
jgi:GNAT superfamily N-acetyltransferase